MTTITLPRATVEQALEALRYFRDTAVCSADTDTANEVIPNLEAALAATRLTIVSAAAEIGKGFRPSQQRKKSERSGHKLD